VVPDAMHDPQLHLEDPFSPTLGSYADIHNIAQVAQVPDIKQEISYHHPHAHSGYPMVYQHRHPHQDQHLQHLDAQHHRSLPSPLDFMEMHMDMGMAVQSNKLNLHVMPHRMGSGWNPPQ
jgi:hypothetical protein